MNIIFGMLKTDDKILGCLFHIIIYIGTGNHFTVKLLQLGRHAVYDTIIIQSINCCLILLVIFKAYVIDVDMVTMFMFS